MFNCTNSCVTGLQSNLNVPQLSCNCIPTFHKAPFRQSVNEWYHNVTPVCQPYTEQRKETSTIEYAGCANARNQDVRKWKSNAII